MSSIQISLLDYFKDSEQFTLKEAEQVTKDVLKMMLKILQFEQEFTKELIKVYLFVLLEVYIRPLKIIALVF